jgi:hypothetical protein
MHSVTSLGTLPAAQALRHFFRIIVSHLKTRFLQHLMTFKPATRDF